MHEVRKRLPVPIWEQPENVSSMDPFKFRNAHRKFYAERQRVKSAKGFYDFQSTEREALVQEQRAESMLRCRQKNRFEGYLQFSQRQENLRLVERMSAIMRDSDKRQKQLAEPQPAAAPVAKAPMHLNFRRKFAQQTDKDNEHLLKRLMKAGPAVATRSQLHAAYSVHANLVQTHTHLRRRCTLDPDVPPPPPRQPKPCGPGRRPAPYVRQKVDEAAAAADGDLCISSRSQQSAVSSRLPAATSAARSTGRTRERRQARWRGPAHGLEQYMPGSSKKYRLPPDHVCGAHTSARAKSWKARSAPSREAGRPSPAAIPQTPRAEVDDGRGSSPKHEGGSSASGDGARPEGPGGPGGPREESPRAEAQEEAREAAHDVAVSYANSIASAVLQSFQALVGDEDKGGLSIQEAGLKGEAGGEEKARPEGPSKKASYSSERQDPDIAPVAEQTEETCEDMHPQESDGQMVNEAIKAQRPQQEEEEAPAGYADEYSDDDWEEEFDDELPSGEVARRDHHHRTSSPTERSLAEGASGSGEYGSDFESSASD